MRLRRLRNIFRRGGVPSEGLLAHLELGSAPGPAPAPAVFSTAGAAVRGGGPPGVAHSTWSAVQVDVVEELWGDGFLTPGGEEEVMRLAAPLGLSSSSTVLLLGAGTGGAAQVLAAAFDAWVSGFEADPTLVSLAAARLKQAGGKVFRRASVGGWDPAAPALKPRGFNHAVVLDAIHDDASQVLLSPVSMALKPGGHLVLVQMVCDSRIDRTDPAFAAWASLERREPAIPVAADISRVLQRLKFDVRVMEDVSARHMHLVLEGWATLVGALDGPKPAPLHAAAIVREAERWMRRLRLMQSGQLRLVRWHAIGP